MAANERRPLTAEMRSWLQQELAVWQQEQLIVPQNGEKILSLYETTDAEQQRVHSQFVIALCGLAALLFAAAVFLLVGFNWEALTAAGKLAVVFGILISTYAIGIVSWRMGYPRLAEVIFFVAALLYGAAIWLIAQIFHMSAHYPDGFFWWAVGVLPLALILDTLLLHALFAGLVCAWAGSEIIGYGGLGALFFGFRTPWLANGAYLAPLLLAPGVWLAYRNHSSARVALYVAAVSWWVCLQPVAWRWESGTSYFVGAVGAMLLILGESHPARSPLAIPYRLFGVLLFGGALLPLSFHGYYRWWRTEHDHPLLLALIIASLTGLVAAAAEFARYRYLEAGHDQYAARWDDIRRRQWLPLTLAALMAGLALIPALAGGNLADADPGLGILSALLANAAMLTMAIWLMWVGVRDNRAQPFVAGVGYFLLWLLLRYSDLFGFEAGMLGAAAFFAACGFAIGGLAWLWHRRKEFIHV
jgi:uncharacterized membrane protein